MSTSPGGLSAAQRVWGTPDLRHQFWHHLGVRPYAIDQYSHLLRISRSTFPELAGIIYKRFRFPDFDTFRASVPPERRLLYLSFVQYLDKCPFDSRDPPDQFMADIDGLLREFPNVLVITSPDVAEETEPSLVRTPSVTPAGELPRFILHDSFGSDILEIDRDKEDLDEDWALPERITRGGLQQLEFTKDGPSPDDPPDLRDTDENTELMLYRAWNHDYSYFCWGRVSQLELRIPVNIANLVNFLEHMEKTKPAVLPDHLGVNVVGDVSARVLWRLLRFASNNLQSLEIRAEPGQATVTARPGHLIGITARKMWERLGTKCKQYLLPVRAQAPATALPSAGNTMAGPEDDDDVVDPQTFFPEQDTPPSPLPLNLESLDLVYTDYNPRRTFGNGARIPLDVPVMDELASYVLDVWGEGCRFHLAVRMENQTGPGAALLVPAGPMAEALLNDMVQAQLGAMRARRRAVEAARLQAAVPAKVVDVDTPAPENRGWRRLEPHERVK